jgi:hypothetical protein
MVLPRFDVLDNLDGFALFTPFLFLWVVVDVATVKRESVGFLSFDFVCLFG